MAANLEVLTTHERIPLRDLCDGTEYGVLGLLGGSEWGTGGLGERRTTVSTSVTKGKQEQETERESGLASL